MLPRQGYRQVRQQAVIASRDLMTALDIRMQPGHLADPEYGLHIGHPIVVAKIDLLIIPRAVGLAFHERRITGDPMAAQQAEAGREMAVICQSHTAFGGSDDLYRVEAEDGDVAVATVAYGLPLVAAADGVGRILDDAETIFLPKGMDSSHITGLAGQMHRHHHLWQSPSLLCSDQLLFQPVRAKIPSPRVDIDEVYRRPAIKGTIGRRNESVGRGPKQIART